MDRTDKQREASRRNGAKSKGPKTAQGKKRSSKNAIKHGAMAEVHTPSGEAPERLAEIQTGLVRRLGPQGGGELEVVRSIGSDLMRLDRLEGAEQAAIALAKTRSHVTEEQNEDHNNYVVHRMVWRQMKSLSTGILAAMGREERSRDAQLIVDMAMKQLEALGTFDISIDGATRILNLQSALGLTGKEGTKGNVEIVVELSQKVLDYLDRLAQRRVDQVAAQREYEEQLAAIPDEKLIRRFDRYRQAIEKSMLRRLDILKGLRELGVDVQLGDE